jgi:hypothetical protein
MSLLKRPVCLVACIGLTAVLFGCRTSQPKPKAPVSPTPPQTNVQSNVIIINPSESRPMPPADSADNIAPNLLAWDATAKTYRAKPGEEFAHFIFSVTNISPEIIMIYDTSSTCDCTVAKLPATPWALAPKRSGQISATIDLRKKSVGINTNYVIVFTSKGNRMLTLEAIVPPSTNHVVIPPQNSPPAK